MLTQWRTSGWPAVPVRVSTDKRTIDRAQSLQPHYAKTLDAWATRLCRQRVEAIALLSEDVHLRYMKYLNGCAELFRDGYTDVHQFTLRKTGSDA